MEEIIANYKDVLSKYSVFTGRAGRKEYWYFFLANFIISFGLGIVSNIIGDDYGILGLLYSLAVIVPGIAVSVRRMHDVGKSGWILLITFIPFAGFYLLYLAGKMGDKTENAYGPVPQRRGSVPVAADAGQQTPEQPSQQV